ncbi:MAG: hypothetical protein ACWGNB_01255 [Thiogranum sp.]
MEKCWRYLLVALAALRDGNGKPVSSGVYIYRFEAGSYIRTRKMLLMK